MAELGLVQTNDKYGGLKQFQEFRTELEDIFSGEGGESLTARLERQFPSNAMIKGYPTWNVPLSDTLNSMPPSIHNLNDEECSEIAGVKTLVKSGAIMTTSLDGSVNIWDTKVKLHRVAQHNFKAQMFKDEVKDKKLLSELFLCHATAKDQVKIIYA
jgi:hypothetical protein